jgi:hypothetical protein
VGIWLSWISKHWRNCTGNMIDNSPEAKLPGIFSIAVSYAIQDISNKVHISKPESADMKCAQAA